MVRPGGFEPLAFRVGAERSIQLSYDRIMFFRTLAIIAHFDPKEKGKNEKCRRLYFFLFLHQIIYNPSRIRFSR